MARYDFSDEECAGIKPLFPAKGGGPAHTYDRQVLNGVFHMLRTGAICRSGTISTQPFIIAMSDRVIAVSSVAFSKPSRLNVRTR